MSLAFQRALALTLGYEGGYSNDPVDRGGATKWGITQRTYDVYRRTHREPVRPVRELERAEMEVIYEVNYWDEALCGALPLNLAICHFDAAVNHGPRQAAKFLQRAIGADPDGYLGPLSQAALDDALATAGEPDVIRAYLDARKDFYAMLIDLDPSQSRFERGWNNRVNNLAKVLLDNRE